MSPSRSLYTPSVNILNSSLSLQTSKNSWKFLCSTIVRLYSRARFTNERGGTENECQLVTNWRNIPKYSGQLSIASINSNVYLFPKGCLKVLLVKTALATLFWTMSGSDARNFFLYEELIYQKILTYTST